MMHTRRDKRLLLNKIFIACLLLLTLNDHIFKELYGNWLTGKLSDFAGLLLLPLAIAYVFPGKRKYAALYAGLFFIFWKSPLSEWPIYWYNQVAPIPITRIIDYTDLLALGILPLVHRLIRKIDQLPEPFLLKVNWHPAIILLPLSLVFMATSPPKRYYLPNREGIVIQRFYQIDKSEGQILEYLQQQGFKVVPDSTARVYYRPSEERYKNYRIEKAVFPGEKDTIECIYFSLNQYGDLNKTELSLNRVYLGKNTSLTEAAQMLKRTRRHYRKLLKSEIIRELKKD